MGKQAVGALGVTEERFRGFFLTEFSQCSITGSDQSLLPLRKLEMTATGCNHSFSSLQKHPGPALAWQ